MAPANPRGPAVAVVGAGVGGLAAAIRLQAAGARVTVFERSATVGGKLREVEVGGRLLSAGPSVLTMRYVFEELFAAAGTRLSDHVTLLPVDPACRHFFPDGSRLDLSNDPQRSREAIRLFAGEKNARGFDALQKQAARIFDVVHQRFMESPVPRMRDLLSPALLFALPQFIHIDSGRTLWKALEELFPDERLRVLYGRYATYNGSSPFLCPATLAVIIHVEQQFGIQVVQGGLYRLAEALAGVARSLGVAIHTGASVERVRAWGGQVRGLTVDGEPHDADAVVANCDAAQLYGRLLPGDPAAARAAEKVSRLEPSLSAFVLLATAAVGDFPLAHHNVFFSSDYRREFDELFDRRLRRPPEDPTVYLCAQDRAPGLSPPPDGIERHLLLSNAPPLDEASRTDWSALGPHCRSRLLATLERYHLALSPTAEQAVTPVDLEALFPASRGSIYGASSNSKMAAFERPENRVKGWRGLYLVGGSAHPGAGIPMVALSGKIAARLAAEDLGLAPSRPPSPRR
ncbi:MAG: phytoene desaturase [Myxococcales bacterium]|nr:phytoene desaturase [Myxococcales bacterium]